MSNDAARSLAEFAARRVQQCGRADRLAGVGSPRHRGADRLPTVVRRHRTKSSTYSYRHCVIADMVRSHIKHESDSCLYKISNVLRHSNRATRYGVAPALSHVLSVSAVRISPSKSGSARSAAASRAREVVSTFSGAAAASSRAGAQLGHVHSPRRRRLARESPADGRAGSMTLRAAWSRRRAGRFTPGM